MRRGIVEPGPQYYLPIEATAQIGWLALNGEVGRWIGNKNVPDQWGRGLIAGHEFNDRTELYAELYDLQAINRIGDQPKQRALRWTSADARRSTAPAIFACCSWAGARIQAVTRTNGEPSWIAYLGVQLLLGPKEKEVPGKQP